MSAGFLLQRVIVKEWRNFSYSLYLYGWVSSYKISYCAVIFVHILGEACSHVTAMHSCVAETKWNGLLYFKLMQLEPFY